MRIQAFRTWLGSAVNQGWGAMHRAKKAIGKRIRSLTDGVDAGVGVGDDESSFGGHRTQVWWELLEEARKKVRGLFDKNTFERFPRIERLLKRFLGSHTVKAAPKLPPPKRPTGPLGVHSPPTTPEAEAFRAQVRQGMLQNHIREHAGLRDAVRRPPSIRDTEDS